MSTQRDTALEILRTLAKTIDAQASLVTALQAILDDAQNDPPQGRSDKTIGDQWWTDMRTLTEHLERAQCSMKEMRSYLINPPAL